MKRALWLGVIILLILAGAYAYFDREETAPDLSLLNPPPPDESAPRAEWSGLLPEIQKALLRESPELQVEKGRGIAIHEEADLTSDGITEVLVDAGVGGAYTDSLVLMEIKNGGPTVAQLSTKEGDIIHADSFLEGASVRNGEETNLMPERGGVYAAHYSLDNSGALEFCEVEVYVWRSGSGLYEFHADLSAVTEATYCADLRARLAEPPSEQ